MFVSNLLVDKGPNRHDYQLLRAVHHIPYQQNCVHIMPILSFRANYQLILLIISRRLALHGI